LGFLVLVGWSKFSVLFVSSAFRFGLTSASCSVGSIVVSTLSVFDSTLTSTAGLLSIAGWG